MKGYEQHYHRRTALYDDLAAHRRRAGFYIVAGLVLMAINLAGLIVWRNDAWQTALGVIGIVCGLATIGLSVWQRRVLS
jgi:hypothetical protein